MFCRNCGTEIPDNSVFCMNCGNKMDGAGSKPEKKRKKKPVKQAGSRTGLLIACIVLLIAGVAAGIFGYLYLSFYGPISETEEAISQIGVVSLESERQIQEAEALYGKLSQKAKAEVDNAHLLTDARKTYERKVKTVEEARSSIEAAKNVTYQVEGRFWVDLSNESVVTAAREAYDALAEEDLAAYVSDQTVGLKNAEQGLANARADALYRDASAKREYGAYDQAIVVYRELIETYPGYAVSQQAQSEITLCYVAMADSAYASKDYELALAFYQQALNEDPDQTDSKNGIVNSTMMMLEEDLKQDNLEKVSKTLAATRRQYGETDALKNLETRLQRRISQIRPQNGALIARTTTWGQGTFTFYGGSKDTLVKLQSTTESDKYHMVYVRANSSVKIEVPDGLYVVKCASGDTWYGNHDLFGEDTVYSKTDSTYRFNTYFEGYYVVFNVPTLNLNNMGGGSESSIISADKF